MAYLTPFHLAVQLRDKLPYRALILTDEPGIPDDAYLLQEWFSIKSYFWGRVVFWQIQWQ